MIVDRRSLLKLAGLVPFYGCSEHLARVRTTHPTDHRSERRQYPGVAPIAYGWLGRRKRGRATAQRHIALCWHALCEHGFGKRIVRG